MKYIYIFVCICCQFACKNSINIELPNPPDRLVVNALLQPDSFVQVQVTLPGDMTGSGSFTYINDAIVEIWLNGVNQETLLNPYKGIYKSTHIKTSIGKEYTIVVKTENYPEVSVKQTIPTIVPITDASSKFLKIYNPERVGRIPFEMEVQFKDPANETNYYEIIFLHGTPNLTYFNGFYVPSPNGDSIFYPNDKMYEYYAQHKYTPNDTFSVELHLNEKVESDDPLLKYEFDKNITLQSLVFSDVAFNGQEVNLKAVAYQFFQDLTNTPSLNFTVLRSVSKDYYLFMKSWYKHRQSRTFTPITGESLGIEMIGLNPIGVYSNIPNGFGLIAGFSQSMIYNIPIK